jgi:hypothetical protein
VEAVTTTRTVEPSVTDARVAVQGTSRTLTATSCAGGQLSASCATMK